MPPVVCCPLELCWWLWRGSDDLLTKPLHRIVANPWVYDMVQILAGRRQLDRQLAAQIAPLRSASFVLDVGGGTGLSRTLWPETCAYMCLDLDSRKLEVLRGKSQTMAMLADAISIPIQDSSVDVILCTVLTHHLSDESLVKLFVESVRVLKPNGKFILVDGVWKPERRIGRMLWRYDRGSYPRTAETLRALFSTYFGISYEETIMILHEYLLCTGVKLP